MQNEGKKKILYVITKSNYGGAQRYVYDLATAMHDDGHEVVVAFGGTGTKNAKPGTLNVLLAEHGIRTIFVQNFVRDVLLLSDIGAFFELRKIIKQERPDIVHLNSSKAGAIGALAAWISGVSRTVFTSHGLAYNESWRPGWQRLLIRYVTWLTIFLSDVTILISKETLKEAQSLGFKHKVTLVYNGIHPPVYRDRKSAQDVLSKKTNSGIRENHFWLGTIAELHPNKNLGVVVEALAALKRDDVEFVVIGEGGEKKKLYDQAERLGIAEKVHLLGFVADAATYVNAFDAFILPSKKEGLPYVILEAGLAGLPVIASKISGNSDIIEHDENGLLIAADPDSICTALSWLLEDKELRKRLGKNLKNTVETRFSTKKMFEETSALYSINSLT